MAPPSPSHSGNGWAVAPVALNSDGVIARSSSANPSCGSLSPASDYNRCQVSHVVAPPEEKCRNRVGEQVRTRDFPPPVKAMTSDSENRTVGVALHPSAYWVLPLGRSQVRANPACMCQNRQKRRRALGPKMTMNHQTT
ncbi:hypothetical protein DICA2_B02278 [Diutina catenulata]